MKKYIITFLLLLSFVGAQQTARQFFGIILDPAEFRLDVNPGFSVNGTVKLTNDFQNQKEVTYFPYVSSFRQIGETGDADLYFGENLNPNRDAAQWVEFEEKSFKLNYGETIEAKFSINAPIDAVSGGYYLAVIFSDKEVSLEDGGQIGLGQEIGTLVFLTINGNNTEDGKVLEFYSGSSLYEAPPVDLYIRYQNNGNVHSTIGGNIFIHQGDVSKPVATLTVNPSNRLTLPGNIRAYQESVVKGFLYGNNAMSFDFGSPFYFGEYTATLKLKHMENGEKVTTEKSIKFWVIPWKLILVSLLILATLIYIVKRKSSIKK